MKKNYFPIPRQTAARGQASLEFILVLVFMLVVVAGVIVPLGQNLQSALEDVSVVGSLSAGSVRLEQDMNALLSLQSQGVLSRDIYLPKGTSLRCDPASKSISFTFSLARDVFRLDGSVPQNCVDNPAGAVPAMECVHKIQVPSTADLSCQGLFNQPFSVDTGAAGFSQHVRMGVKYDSTQSPPYVLDFNTG